MTLLPCGAVGLSVVCDGMRGSRKFCNQRGSNCDVLVLFLFIILLVYERVHYNQTSFEWCFAGVPMMAQQ